MKKYSEYGIIGGWFSVSALFALSFYKGGSIVSLIIQVAEYLIITALLFLFGYLGGGLADTLAKSKAGKIVFFILFMAVIFCIYYSAGTKFFNQ